MLGYSVGVKGCGGCGECGVVLSEGVVLVVHIRRAGKIDMPCSLDD